MERIQVKSYTFLIHNIYHIGGTTRSVINLANCLNSYGHQVTLLTVFKSGKLPAYPVDKNVQIDYIIDYSNPVSIYPKVINRLRKYTSFFKPKIIQPDEPGMNQFSSYIEKKIIKKIKGVKSDYLVGTRATYNLLIAEYSKGLKTIGMEHMHFNAHPTRLQQKIVNEYRHLNYITTLTQADQKVYRKYFNAEKIIWLPNIMAPQQVNSKKKKIITALGRLEHEKGFDLLIEAVNLIQHQLRELQYKVMLYGDGSKKSSLMKQIMNDQLSDIISIYPSNKNIKNILDESLITVIPSRSEGFGMVILEAFAFNNAVVSFDAQMGPKELLIHRKNALVASCYDTNQLSKYIVELINDDSLREQLIYGGKETASNYYPEKIYNKLKDQIE